MAIYSYLWAFSTVSKTVLLANPTYNVELFTPQSDQGAGFPWREPGGPKMIRPEFVRVVEVMDESWEGDGTYSFAWHFVVWTPGQFAFVDTGQWGGGSLRSGPATVQTWTDWASGGTSGSYQVFQCNAKRPEMGKEYVNQDGFYRDVVVKFTGGILQV